VLDGAVGTRVGRVNGAPVVMVGKIVGNVGRVGNKLGSVGRPVADVSLDDELPVVKLPSVVELPPVEVLAPDDVELPSVVLEPSVVDPDEAVKMSSGLAVPVVAAGNGFPSSSQSPIWLFRIGFIGGA